jgi:hypothetical protein
LAVGGGVGDHQGSGVGVDRGLFEGRSSVELTFRQLPVFLYLEGARLARSEAAGVARHGKDEEEYERMPFGYMMSCSWANGKS